MTNKLLRNESYCRAKYTSANKYLKDYAKFNTKQSFLSWESESLSRQSWRTRESHKKSQLGQLSKFKTFSSSVLWAQDADRVRKW